MKLVSIKHIKVSSNGTISFSYNCLTDFKQVIFHEKDLINSSFFIKSARNQTFKNLSQTSYKSKYKF